MYRKKSQGWVKHLDFIFLDLICLWASYVIAYYFRHQSVAFFEKEMYLSMFYVLGLIDIIVCFFKNTFSNVLKRDNLSELIHTISHDVLVIMLSLLYLFLIKSGDEYSRLVVFYMGAIYLLLGYCTRIIWKKKLLYRYPSIEKSLIVLVTTENLAEHVVESIKNSIYENIKIIGLCILDKDLVGDDISDYPIIGNRDNLFENIKKEWVDIAFVSLPGNYPEHETESIIDALVDMGLVVHEKILEYESKDEDRVHIYGNYLVKTYSINVADPFQLFLKRLMDIAAGLAGGAVTVVLMIIIGPLIYIKSPGPIFFKQVRIGKNGKKFYMYKFRSMYLDAEERKQALMEENRIKDGLMFKMEFDPRIIGSKQLPDGTKKKGIGNYIRDWSLDEFPQFFNVLKGDMSLVGTRPPTVDEWEKYEMHHRGRMAMKPGITGLWQVSGRNEITDFEQVVSLDKQYISNWSIMLDLKIIAKTFKVVLKREGSM